MTGRSRRQGDYHPQPFRPIIPPTPSFFSYRQHFVPSVIALPLPPPPSTINTPILLPPPPPKPTPPAPANQPTSGLRPTTNICGASRKNNCLFLGPTKKFPSLPTRRGQESGKVRVMGRKREIMDMCVNIGEESRKKKRKC